MSSVTYVDMQSIAIYSIYCIYIHIYILLFLLVWSVWVSSVFIYGVTTDIWQETLWLKISLFINVIFKSVMIMNKSVKSLNCSRQTWIDLQHEFILKQHRINNPCQTQLQPVIFTNKHRLWSIKLWRVDENEESIIISMNVFLSKFYSELQNLNLNNILENAA